MNRGEIAGRVAVVVLFLYAIPPGLASQPEIDAIIAQVSAGFRQTFDGSTLRPWQETYQAACLKEIRRMAQLLQEDGTELTRNPYQEHRDLLRQTLSRMQDMNVRAMDSYVQTSQKMLALPPNSAEANALLAQMGEQDKTVKHYNGIIAALRERLTYLEKCVRYAERAFSDAVNARQSQAAKLPAPSTSSHPGVLADDGEGVKMPTGVKHDIDIDPKKGISIGGGSDR